MSHHLPDNTRGAFLAGIVIGAIAALTGVKIATDAQEKAALEQKIEELTPDPTRDR